jgi:hypothetical protein
MPQGLPPRMIRRNNFNLSGLQVTPPALFKLTTRPMSVAALQKQTSWPAHEFQDFEKRIQFNWFHMRGIAIAHSRFTEATATHSPHVFI